MSKSNINFYKFNCFNKGICPICNREMNLNKLHDGLSIEAECKNGCIQYRRHFSNYIIYFFNDLDAAIEFKALDSEYAKINTNNIINNNVDYWKKDDRYLTKILSI